MAFFDYLIDKSLHFLIKSKQMIKSRPLPTDEVLIYVDLPVGDGAGLKSLPRRGRGTIYGG